MENLRGVGLFCKKIKDLDKKYLLFVVILVFLLIELLVFINTAVGLSAKDSKNLFEYVAKVRDASECLDKIFERSELSLNVLADSITNSYNVKQLQSKDYNFNYIKSIDPMLKSVLTNTPGVAGAWFQLNATLPFSAWAFNWYEYQNNQFLDMNDKFKQTPSQLRRINPNEDPYYFDAIGSKQPVWSGLYKDPDTGEDFLTISTPVYNQNTLIGVAGLDISKEELNQALSNVHLILNDVDLYLLDRKDNVMLAHMANGSTSKRDDKFLDLMKTSKEEPVAYYNNFTRKTAVAIYLSNNYKLVISIENKNIFVGEHSLITVVYVLFVLFLMASIYILVCVTLKQCADKPLEL